MFRKTEIRIVASIMGILAFVWIAMLAAIYVSGYVSMSEHNRQMLKEHSDMYMLHRAEPQMRGREGSPEFQLTTFYTVAVSYSGRVIETVNSSPVYSDDALEGYALEIYESGKKSGSRKDLAYYVAAKEGYILVAFMDNTVINGRVKTFLKFTFIFGGIALVIFFFISRYIAGRIVKPLEESHIRQKKFISDAGHELKTPVSVVSANAELLRREIGDNRWLSNIQYENERMGSLVSQMLALARAESIQQKKERLEFGRLVQGEVLPFESMAYEKGIQLKTSIEEGIYVSGSGSQLKQLVSILTDNAVKHGTPGTYIYVRLFREKGKAVLAVINTGEPIAEEDRKHIFEIFYRCDEARTAEDNSYGLGLSIAEAIVNAHKGEIGETCHDGLVEFTVKLSEDN